MATISLLALHGIAVAFGAAPTAATVADMGGAVVPQLIHAIAFSLQFVVPPGFLIGATASYLKRSRSIRLLEKTRTGDGQGVASLTWRQFESLVAEGFRQRGFTVTEKGGGTPDGGVDIVLVRGTELFLVQCKQWRARQVPVTAVRELYGVMAAQHAAAGYVVTSGQFTKDAMAFAAGRNIELIDGETLPALLRLPKNIPPASTIAPVSATDSSSPSCPRCRTPMVARVAKRGANPGNEFWGCCQYRQCTATLAKL